MRIVDIRPAHSAQDIKAAKELVDGEIGHPSKTVMFILGKSPAIAQLADRAGTRSDPFPWRESVWLRVSRANGEKILGSSRFQEWFPNSRHCAIVLGLDDNIVATLKSSASLLEIENAFLQA